MPGLRRLAWLAALAAAAAMFAAGAEIWRFTLMLHGRTVVLDGSVVRTSDVLVAAGGILAPLTAVIALVAAVPVLTRTHRAAAARLGRAPSRSRGAIAARLLVPGWNVYGAGQVVVEIDRMLGAATASGDADEPFEAAGGSPAQSQPRAARITICWWLSWVVSAVLLIATLARGLGGSLQAIADTVELHIAVDLVAALVAILAVLVLRRFRKLLTPPVDDYQNWVVQPPAPTRPATPAAVAAGR